jgi:hypothetical protein
MQPITAQTPQIALPIAQTTSTAESGQTANAAITRIQPENSTLGKIGAALSKIKTVAITPGLAALSAGFAKVGAWTQAHPTASFIIGMALAILSIVGMATGGPAGIVFGGMGLAAGSYLVAKGLPAALKKWKSETPQSAAAATAHPPPQPAIQAHPLPLVNPRPA